MAGLTLAPEYALYELLYGEPLEVDLVIELEAVEVAIVLLLPPFELVVNIFC